MDGHRSFQLERDHMFLSFAQNSDQAVKNHVEES